MPLKASGWTSEEDERLAELVRPHTLLYNVSDPSHKNILERESTWKGISDAILKPVDECKKRWRGIRDGYMRSKRSGSWHRAKVSLHEKLQFLDESEDFNEQLLKPEANILVVGNDLETEKLYMLDNPLGGVGTEVSVVEPQSMEDDNNPLNTIIKDEVKQKHSNGKVVKKRAGRKRVQPPSSNMTPVKILPKPMNGPGFVKVQGSEVVGYRLGHLIDKVLTENTNEVDVFFKSMAASVKKLQPKLIPKVKMEVCNVVSKYEMENYTEPS